MWLTLLALRNRIGILMLSLAMVVLGMTSLQRLPVSEHPGRRFVGVIYKGAPPLDIEQSVVYPIEKAVSSASNVEHVESFAKQGIERVDLVQLGERHQRRSDGGDATHHADLTASRRILQPFIVKFDVSYCRGRDRRGK